MGIARSRPVGISIIAILLGIQGVLEVVYSILVLIRAPGFVTITANTAIIVRVSPWGFLISGILALVFAYGLWTLRGWAFWGVIALELLNLMGGTILLFTFNYTGAVLLDIIIPLVILIYFCADRNVFFTFIHV